MTHIVDIVKHISGNSTMGIDTCTVVNLKGGQKNPQQGRVTKIQNGSRVMAFQNKAINGYEAMVNRRLVSEGKNPDNFKLGKRVWGTRLENLPIVEHKDALYLEVIFLTPGEVHYELDGVKVNEADIVGLPAKPVSNGQGGVDDQVIIRTFKASSLVAVRINHTEYTNITL